jgi:type III restriction enzyme
MPRRRKYSDGQLTLEGKKAGFHTAPCVPSIAEALDDWRKNRYEGATETSRILLNYWFHTDHRLANGTRFQYYDAQREAIETVIYLYEVARARRLKQLLEKFADFETVQLLQHDDYARYCLKMATGTGKTKVMALAYAWQYFNAVAEPSEEYAKTTVIIAPNVIVFERLRTDFSAGRIFRADPIVPPELAAFWDVECYARGEGERATSQGALYLTNIQQFYQREVEDSEAREMTDVLGSIPPERNRAEDFEPRILARGGPILVINDEAHHTHDEELKWNEFIRRLNGPQNRVCAQLDFSATPRFSEGGLFTWTVYDYPLKKAIQAGIVKSPIKGIATGIQEARSDIASTKYRAYLTAAVERWREYRGQLKPLLKKPVLFVMMNDTNDADDVADYLRAHYPEEFGGEKLLVIHTDKKGEVTKKDLEIARKVAREVDEGQSPVNAIVSVLMLREGWDVQNVTVVVGLRPYTSKANILPEQTIGRGLRLMFRDLATSYKERVDVIGNRAFISFVEQLERDEDIQLPTFEIGKEKLEIVTIAPDQGKIDKDISLPILTPILVRKKSLSQEIASLNVQELKCPRLPRRDDEAAIKTFTYEGYDFITLQKLIERKYTIPEAQTAQEVISYYAKNIAQDVKLPSQFAYLAPKIREFLETRAFGEKVNLDDQAILKSISSNVAQYVVVQTFVKALRAVIVEEHTPQLAGPEMRLSDTKPFPFSRRTFGARKCVFNLVPCDNEFELEFAKFLEASEVQSFSKLPMQLGFAIEYTDATANLRYYDPDFVAVHTDGTHYLIETKGREDIDVPYKDRAATLWCENATKLTGTKWRYLKILQIEFGKLQPTRFEELLVLGHQQQLQ